MSIEIDNVKAKTNTDITNSTVAKSVSALEVGTQINAVADVVELFNNSRKSEIGTLTTDVNALKVKVVNTTDVTEGTKLFFTEARSIGSLLTGYVKAATGRVLAATDSVLVAMGVLEKRIEVNETSIGGALTQLTTTNKSTLISAINEVNAKPAFTYSFLAYGALTAEQKRFQGTVSDTVANLGTTAAQATVFPEGWMILFTDGAVGQKVKLANGTSALSAITFGIDEDLGAKFRVGHVKEASGVLELTPDSEFMRIMRELGKTINGETEIARMDSGNSSLVTGWMRGTLHKPKKSVTGLTTLTFNVKTAGVFTDGATNLARIYEYDPVANTAVLISESANSGAIFKTAGKVNVVMPSYNIDKAKFYYFCLRYTADGTATTTPVISANTGQSFNGAYDGVKFSIYTNTAEPLPTTLDIATIGTNATIYAFSY